MLIIPDTQQFISLTHLSIFTMMATVMYIYGVVFCFLFII